jgi:predicted nucleic-acid-binding protein
MKAKQMKEITHANYLANEIESLKKRAKKIASKAEKDGDYRTALQGVRELTRIVELLAKMRGELYEQSVNVIINNQWVEIRTKILSALEDYPDAKIELSRVLDDVK